jgi:hypothetical protein
MTSKEESQSPMNVATASCQRHKGDSAGHVSKKKGLSLILNRQRQKEGTFCVSALAAIEPTPARSGRAGYARLNLSATGGTSEKKLS